MLFQYLKLKLVLRLILFNFLDIFSMEGYYYGILRKYTEEIKKKHQQLKGLSDSSSLASASTSSSSSSLDNYHQTTPLVCNQTSSVTSYNSVYIPSQNIIQSFQKFYLLLSNTISHSFLSFSISSLSPFSKYCLNLP